MKFKYGYIFYRDPVDTMEGFHEIIDLTDEEATLPKKLVKLRLQVVVMLLKIG